MRHVYIVGSKGIPARYGGFETFVEKLTEYKKSDEIKYHVSSLRSNSELSLENDYFEYNGATVFSVDVPQIGAAKAIVYDIKALKQAVDDAKANNYEEPYFYVLASRIGPFIKRIADEIHGIGGKLFLNPDGNEWKRAKWSAPIRAYWKISEQLMVKNADLVIADNPKIEEYIHKEYAQYDVESTYIAYGTDAILSTLTFSDEVVTAWYAKHSVNVGNYYLIVGRFVPENNYETMIREFIQSKTDKQLVIITNVEKNKFYKDLQKKTNFESDKRVKFVGTVYEQELLKFIRENSFAYLHGHEVGGTNPSLLEALATTKLNMLVDVDFNRAVAGNSAVYWQKTEGNLSQLIDQTDSLNRDSYLKYNELSKNVVAANFTWADIVEKYENVFR